MTTRISVTAVHDSGEELNPFGEIFHVFATACGVKIRDYNFDFETKVTSAIFEMPIGKVESFCAVIQYVEGLNVNTDQDDHVDAVGRLSRMPNWELGHAVKRYLEDSDHGGWDGYEPSDIAGVDALLIDLVKFIDNGGAS